MNLTSLGSRDFLNVCSQSFSRVSFSSSPRVGSLNAPTQSEAVLRWLESDHLMLINATLIYVKNLIPILLNLN